MSASRNSRLQWVNGGCAAALNARPDQSIGTHPSHALSVVGELTAAYCIALETTAIRGRYRSCLNCRSCRFPHSRRLPQQRRGGQAASAMQLQCSAIYDAPLQRFSLSAEPVSGRAGVAGVVFLNKNGDGVRQGNEQPIPAVSLHVNNRALTTEARGYFMVWGVPAYSEQQIIVDSTSFTNPTWMVSRAMEQVRAVPGAFTTADIPVVVAGRYKGKFKLRHVLQVISFCRGNTGCGYCCATNRVDL